MKRQRRMLSTAYIQTQISPAAKRTVRGRMVLSIATEDSDTDTCVKQIAFHSSTSIVFAVLALRISLTISSAERSSFHAPVNRSAQPVSALAVFAGARLFTYANTLASSVSLSAISPMARYSSAFNSIAVIILLCLVSACKDTNKRTKYKTNSDIFSRQDINDKQ